MLRKHVPVCRYLGPGAKFLPRLLVTKRPITPDKREKVAALSLSGIPCKAVNSNAGREMLPFESLAMSTRCEKPPKLGSFGLQSRIRVVTNPDLHLSMFSDFCAEVIICHASLGIDSCSHRCVDDGK